jgi:hypothetical protein
VCRGVFGRTATPGPLSILTLRSPDHPSVTRRSPVGRGVDRRGGRAPAVPPIVFRHTSYFARTSRP